MTRERVIAYVDGFNLYHGLRNLKDGRYLWLDVEALVRSLVSTEQELLRVHYFTAEIQHRPASYRRQDAYLRAVKSVASVLEVHKGQFKTESAKCTDCGRRQTYRREKESDVALATRLVADAYSGKCDVALLVSGDSDFLPAIAAARMGGVRVVAAFPPGRRNSAVESQVDHALHVDEATLRRAQMTPVVVQRNGKAIERPGFHGQSLAP